MDGIPLDSGPPVDGGLSLGGGPELSHGAGGFPVPHLDPLSITLEPGDYGKEGFEWRGPYRFVQGLLHNYDLVYSVPGLYEAILGMLRYKSHIALANALERQVVGAGRAMTDISVFDVGAGNGLFGEQLWERGVRRLAGADISTVAPMAAERDRPGLYSLGYLVGDLARLENRVRSLVDSNGLNCLTSAGALGPGHMPVETLDQTWRPFPPGSLIALTVQEKVANDGPLLQLLAQTTDFGRPRRVFHRNTMDGKKVHYNVLVGRKKTRQ